MLRRAIAALLCAAAAGCATVQPWQRGQLAREELRFDADAGEVALEEHYLRYREGAAGALGGGGGGCGCN